jgi:hypothetical protein
MNQDVVTNLQTVSGKTANLGLVRLELELDYTRTMDVLRNYIFILGMFSMAWELPIRVSLVRMVS